MGQAVGAVDYGAEVWRSDGSTTGTFRVSDIFPGSGSSNPAELIVLNGAVYLSADDGVSGRELWRVGDTGVVRVKDLVPAGTLPSNPQAFTSAGSGVYFTADDGTHGRELWKSDGTTAGTVLVKDIAAGSTGSNPTVLTEVNGALFFAADGLSTGTTLWKSAGTSAGTFILKAFDSGPELVPVQDLVNVNGTVFFTASDSGTGRELWKSDGAVAGTVLVRDIVSGSVGSDPRALVNVGGTLSPPPTAEAGARMAEAVRSTAGPLAWTVAAAIPKSRRAAVAAPRPMERRARAACSCGSPCSDLSPAELLQQGQAPDEPGGAWATGSRSGPRTFEPCWRGTTTRTSFRSGSCRCAGCAGRLRRCSWPTG